MNDADEEFRITFCCRLRAAVHESMKLQQFHIALCQVTLTAKLTDDYSLIPNHFVGEFRLHNHDLCYKFCMSPSIHEQ